MTTGLASLQLMLYCTALYCTVPHCLVPHCTALYRSDDEDDDDDDVSMAGIQSAFMAVLRKQKQVSQRKQQKAIQVGRALGGTA